MLIMNTTSTGWTSAGILSPPTLRKCLHHDTASSGGTKSTEELIAGCRRGILVTHFFYIRFLDQRTILPTGLTRDGTFLIEKCQVTQAVKNSDGAKVRCV
ncbi:MAG: metallopeptidase TldD-related protein [Gemmatimonadaceae bacterium]